MFCVLWISLCFIRTISEEAGDNTSELEKMLRANDVDPLEISGAGWAGLIIIIVILLIVLILQTLVYCIAFCGLPFASPSKSTEGKAYLVASFVFIVLGVAVNLMYIIGGAVANSKIVPFNALSTLILIYGVVNLIITIIILINNILMGLEVFEGKTWSFPFTSVIENIFTLLLAVGYIGSIVVGVGALNLRFSLDMVAAQSLKDVQIAAKIDNISQGWIDKTYKSMSSFGTVIIVAFALQIFTAGVAMLSSQARSMIRTSQLMYLGSFQMIMAVILLIPLQLFGKQGLIFFGFKALNDGTFYAIVALTIMMFAFAGIIVLVSFITSFCLFPVLVWVIRLVGFAGFVSAILLIVFSGQVISQRKLISGKLDIYCFESDPLDIVNNGCHAAFQYYIDNMNLSGPGKPPISDFAIKFKNSAKGWMAMLGFAGLFIAIHYLGVSNVLCTADCIPKDEEKEGGTPRMEYVTPGWIAVRAAATGAGAGVDAEADPRSGRGTGAEADAGSGRGRDPEPGTDAEARIDVRAGTDARVEVEVDTRREK